MQTGVWKRFVKWGNATFPSIGPKMTVALSHQVFLVIEVASVTCLRDNSTDQTDQESIIITVRRKHVIERVCACVRMDCPWGPR